MPLDFGIELELLIPGRPYDDVYGETLTQRVGRGVAQRISDAGVPCSFQGYTHRVIPGQWKIVTDGSVSGPAGYVPLEVVSPPLDDSGLMTIDRVCGTLIGLGAKVNRTCGFHTHIAARHLPVQALKRLVYVFIDHEEIIDGLLPPSRRGNNNQYCRSIRDNLDRAALENAVTVSQIQSAIYSGQRYVKLNYGAYYKHGTVEFRQHSGTVDPAKIKKWVIFCNKLVELAVKTADQSPRAGQTTRPSSAEQQLQRRIQRARQLRVIYDAVARPEGATNAEVQVLLRRETPPSLVNDLRRLGVSFVRSGRRGGHAVYKLVPTAAAQPEPEEISLSALLTKLELLEEDRQFWMERAVLLGNVATGALPPDTAELA